MGSMQSDSPNGVAQERFDIRENSGDVGFLDPSPVPQHMSAVTGTEGRSQPIPMSLPNEAPPPRRASPERLREEAAVAGLQNACFFEGATVPPDDGGGAAVVPSILR